MINKEQQKELVRRLNELLETFNKDIKSIQTQLDQSEIDCNNTIEMDIDENDHIFAYIVDGGN